MPHAVGFERFLDPVFSKELVHADVHVPDHLLGHWKVLVGLPLPTDDKSLILPQSLQNSPQAYTLLMDVKSKGFRINVRQRKPRKACPTRMTFNQMETYISCLTDADERLEELHAVMDAGKGQKNQYEYVRRWFLANYPHFYEIPVLDTNCCLVAPRVTMLPEDKEPLKISA